jgi:tRNA(Ile2) C34 agmatinyltransferase TiaS
MRCPKCGRWMHSTTYGYYCEDCGKITWVYEITETGDC